MLHQEDYVAMEWESRREEKLAMQRLAFVLVIVVMAVTGLALVLW